MGGEKQYKIVWFNNIISILSLVTGLSYWDGSSAPWDRYAGSDQARSNNGNISWGSLFAVWVPNTTMCNQRYPANQSHLLSRACSASPSYRISFIKLSWRDKYILSEITRPRGMKSKLFSCLWFFSLLWAHLH